MKRAYLNCVDKTLSFTIGNENFKLQLEGEKTQSAGLNTKQGVYFTTFDFSKQNPQFVVSKDNINMEFFQKGNANSLMEFEDFEVKITVGSRIDYFGMTFPQGFNSFIVAFGIMMREIDGINNYSQLILKIGSMEIFPLVQKWAVEFEQDYYGQDWEELNYEDAIVEYLTNKLKIY